MHAYGFHGLHYCIWKFIIIMFMFDTCTMHHSTLCSETLPRTYYMPTMVFKLHVTKRLQLSSPANFGKKSTHRKFCLALLITGFWITMKWAYDVIGHHQEFEMHVTFQIYKHLVNSWTQLVVELMLDASPVLLLESMFQQKVLKHVQKLFQSDLGTYMVSPKSTWKI